MIGYVMLGTNDLPRASAFYDALLAEIGAKRLMDFGKSIVWGHSMERPALGVGTPYDGKPGTVGNGVVSFASTTLNAIPVRCHPVSLPWSSASISDGSAVTK